MTRAEAIEILYNEIPGCGEKVTYKESERCEAYTIAITALREQEQREWISVKERLPDKREYVLFSSGDAIHYGYYCGSDRWIDRCSEMYSHRVTHWMPLPEPPEED